MKLLLGIHRVSEYLFREYGFVTFPLSAGSKIPPAGSRWRHLQPGGNPGFRSDRENLGLRTGLPSGVIVMDFDSDGLAKDWWDHFPLPSTIVRTRRGWHFYYGLPVTQTGQPISNRARLAGGIDLRGDGGYVVAVPSVIDGIAYRYHDGFGPVHREKLVPFNPDWLRRYEPAKPAPVKPTPSKASDWMHERGRKYISRIRAVSGQKGHSSTWQAVNTLREFGFSQAEALEALTEWNATNADPPWSAKDLAHKVDDCYREKAAP